ncbi:uncharacterized protein N7477_002405 [Penicillium maclennaniae]|uniref:uncharacterized protein n=1 Tax=Penicillium maclennaniae TaxID=1343394 RepID=UPI002540BBA0|nr:uncharacterized protein N7477_002405 [Penicillium maclennaniae]KAJ5676772.1 hypothetical protein N7477_002405 [Penicillium maclennaniae]
MFGPPQLDEATIRSIDFNRTSRRMLQDMGWVVYRTTYRSVPAFHSNRNPHFLDQGGSLRRSPRARHQLTVIEELATLHGASLDVVRGHFEGWVEAQDKQDACNKYRACLVMDEAAV